MCIPVIEPSRKRSHPVESTRKTRAGRSSGHGGLQGYGGHGGLPVITYPIDGRNTFVVVGEPPLPHQPHLRGTCPGEPQWTGMGINGAVSGQLIDTSYAQPYVSRPQMIYAIPRERRDIGGEMICGNGQNENQGRLVTYRPDEREDRRRDNEQTPVVILQTSGGRGRSRARSRPCGYHHRHTRRASRYWDRRRDSSSDDSTLYEYRRPRRRRSFSVETLYD